MEMDFLAKKEQILKELQMDFLFQIHRIHGVIFRTVNRVLHEASLPIQIEQAPILMTVYYAPGISQQEIAAAICRDKSSVQRTLVSLQKKELIRIEQDKTDKRKNIISLTEQGISLTATLKKTFAKVETMMLQHLSGKEQTEAVDTLTALANKLEN
jgi:DNA-binding MarR family transcriptional regulator